MTGDRGSPCENEVGDLQVERLGDSSKQWDLSLALKDRIWTVSIG